MNITLRRRFRPLWCAGVVCGSLVGPSGVVAAAPDRTQPPGVVGSAPQPPAPMVPGSLRPGPRLAVPPDAPPPIPDVPYRQEFHEAAPLATPAENDVRAIAFDRSGNLWAATAAGPRVRIAGKWIAPDGATAVGVCNALAVATDGTVWIAADNGLFRGTASGIAADPLFAGKPMAALGRRWTRLVAAGPDGAWLRDGAGPWRKVPGRFMQNVRAAHPAQDGTIWVGTASGLYLLDPAGRKPVVRLGTPDQLCSSNVHTIVPMADGNLWIGSTGGIDIYASGRRVRSYSSAQGIPSRVVKAIASDAQGRFWCATPIGVVLREGNRFRLRHSRRWLASDDVRDVAVDRAGTVWVANARGVDAIRSRRMTLADKAMVFVDMVRKRHIRPPGLVGPAVLVRPGDLSESFIEDDDNDGEHTGMWMAAESLRYAVTGDPAARENARAAFRAMEVLQSATGTPHFIARSVLPAGAAPRHEVDRVFTPEELLAMRHLDPREKPIEKRWIPSPDGKWLWKRDASSDEVDGHLFGYAMYHALAADGNERARVAALVDRIVGGIVDNGFVLRDIDGKATRWGNWSPTSLNNDPNWNEERYGNSTEILSHLGVAFQLTGKEKYRDAARLLVSKHGYAANMAKLAYVTPSEQTHINDELLGMVFPNLFRHLVLPELEAPARQAIRQWHELGSGRDGIPFYDFVYNTFSGKRVGLGPAMDVLRRWPLDMIEWTVDNRFREDVVFDRTPGRDGVRLTEILPRDEMGLQMWDQEPYFAVIGRGGTREDRPVDWLLAYWMGRYWGIIGPPKAR